MFPASGAECEGSRVDCGRLGILPAETTKSHHFRQQCCVCGQFERSRRKRGRRATHRKRGRGWKLVRRARRMLNTVTGAGSANDRRGRSAGSVGATIPGSQGWKATNRYQWRA